MRLPFDYDLIETADGKRIDAGYVRLHRVADWCAKHGLNLILDLHKTAGFSFDAGEAESGFFDSPAYQERFYALWETIAHEFGAEHDHIAFELLNEVTDRGFCERWNAIAETCIRRIRAIAPETYILIGGYWNNSIRALPDLLPPPDDRIVYNFHCYEPLIFTHQGATWTEKIDPAKRMAYEESETSEQYFEDLIADAVAAAEKYHVPLYCGEYGVIDRVGGEDTLKWYRCIHSVLERHHIGRCAWTYRELDFGLTDARLEGVRGEILQCL